MSRVGGVAGHPRGQRLEARPEDAEVERLVVRLVRDPEAAAGIDQLAAGSRPRPRAAAAAATVASTCAASAAASSTFDAPNACSPDRVEPGRGDRLRRGGSQVGRVHPELAGAVVADEPDALEARRLGHGCAQQDRLAPAQRLGDRAPAAAAPPRDSTVTTRTPASTAAAQLVVALAGPGDDDAVRLEAGAQDVAQLPARGDVRAEPEADEVAHDREAGVRLDGVGEVDGGRQGATEGLDLAA